MGASNGGYYKTKDDWRKILFFAKGGGGTQAVAVRKRGTGLFRSKGEAGSFEM